MRIAVYVGDLICEYCTNCTNKFCRLLIRKKLLLVLSVALVVNICFTGATAVLVAILNESMTVFQMVLF